MTQTDQIIEAFDARARRREERRGFFKNAMGMAAVTAAGAAAMSIAGEAAAQTAATEIDVLNAGVVRIGRSLRIATPLNDLVCDRLAAFEALRERDGPAASADTGGFHRRHAAVVALAVEELLQAAARLA